MRRRSRASSKPTKARSRKAEMPKRRNAATVRAESESARLRRERDEALEREKAIAGVLRVISSSAGPLEPIFQAMLENAVRICQAKFGSLLRFDGKVFHLAARVGTPPELAEAQRQSLPIGPTQGGLLDRAMPRKQVMPPANTAKDDAVGLSAT